MANRFAPYHPIIYVRGYAMTRQEIDDTTADPFCGFNLGSTTYRAVPDKTRPARKFVFESPLVRLGTDFQYTDVYEDGLDIMDPEWTDGIPVRCVVIYRYYEQASTLLGTGVTPAMEQFAKGLSDLILRVRDLVCGDSGNRLRPDDFRCYLVAHSMGGLVCRAFLQNPKLGDQKARDCVDKVFTYATPHNGIEMAGLNVPSWLGADDLDNFNRKRMSKYLDLESLFGSTGRVDWVPETRFPSRRFFCMIGTNRADYEVAGGLSRTFAGHGSDGLVRIENASVWGSGPDGKVSSPCATAYAYRSHSGYFGIVNSEESYQNLVRFLFGDVRVDLWLDVDEVRLPAEIRKEADKGRAVDALYQFELLASPRGKRWYLTRRTAEEDSVACRRLAQLAGPPAKRDASVHLSTVFLAERWRVNPKRPSLSYSLTFGARVPDYEVDRSFWPDRHYEGAYLFRDSALIELTPPRTAKGAWKVSWAWQGAAGGPRMQEVEPETLEDGRRQFSIPFDSAATPGIRGKLRFLASRWNG